MSIMHMNRVWRHVAFRDDLFQLSRTFLDAFFRCKSWEQNCMSPITMHCAFLAQY